MPKAFDAAVHAGGKVRTISGPDKRFGLHAGEYMHVVWHKGKMIRGDVKKKNKVVEQMDRMHK